MGSIKLTIINQAEFLHAGPLNLARNKQMIHWWTPAVLHREIVCPKVADSKPRPARRMTVASSSIFQGLCSLSLCLHVSSSVQQRPALELEWRPSGQAAAAGSAEKKEGRREWGRVGLGWGEAGSHRDAQILMRCTVSMATLSEEGKKKRVLSLAAPRSLLCAPSSGSCCPPPQLARLFVRRQMIPQMPRTSRPFQLHSPASPQVRGHHRASEWVSVATVANGGGESGRGLLFPPFLFFFFILFVLSWLQSEASGLDFSQRWEITKYIYLVIGLK